MKLSVKKVTGIFLSRFPGFWFFCGEHFIWSFSGVFLMVCVCVCVCVSVCVCVCILFGLSVVCF